MRDVFGTYHPGIEMAFFCIVIIFGMIFLHPVFLALAMGGSLSYAVYLKGRKALKFFCIFPLPLMFIAAILNPLFNHRGITILFYLRDNPITLEAAVYGVVSGLMFASVIMWFYCYNEVMGSDKFMFVFGKVIPSISLMFSMVLRFVPRFTAQTRVISNAQKCIGRDVSNGTIRQRVVQGMRILSIMTTWALENAIDTSESMKSRGYGLRGRKTYSNFRFDKRDKITGSVMIAVAVAVIAGGVTGRDSAMYYPMIEFPTGDFFSFAVMAAYFVLCFLPMILNIKEDIKWKRLQSKI